VATVVAIALIAGGIVALVVTAGDDEGGGGGGGGDKPTSEETEELALDIDSIEKRYRALAGSLSAAGLEDECEAGEPGDGESEVVTCEFDKGTLELTTYDDQAALESVRADNTGTAAGNRYSETDTGVVWAMDSTSAVSDAETSTIYWDSTSGEDPQSGLFTFSAAGDESMEELSTVYTSIEPAVKWPTEPEDEGMVALAKEFVNLKKCDRIQTIREGEIEESICSAPKGITIFMGVYKDKADFMANRREAIKQGKEQGYPLRHWNFSGGPRQGAAAEYLAFDVTPTRYWDKPDCLCWMEASMSGGTLKQLENWWVNA